MSQFVDDNTIYGNYTLQSAKQYDQFWLHQSTINSLLYDLTLPLSGAGFETEIFALISEVKAYYGDDTTCSGVVTFPKEKNS